MVLGLSVIEEVRSEPEIDGQRGRTIALQLTRACKIPQLNLLARARPARRIVGFPSRRQIQRVDRGSLTLQQPCVQGQSLGRPKNLVRILPRNDQ